MNCKRIRSYLMAFHLNEKHITSFQLQPKPSWAVARGHNHNAHFILRRPNCTSPSPNRLASLTATSNSIRRKRIAIIGGGASGMFAATAAADKICGYFASGDDGAIDGCDVVVFEGTSRTMSKVRISGGGRCNVMHDRTKSLPQILSSYPRGSKELRGLYTSRFSPNDAYEWFTSRGVQLKTESDGRMFPTSDDSQTIIEAISNAAHRAGVCLRTKEKVDSVEWKEDGGFFLNLSSKSSSQERIHSNELFDSVVLATGSFPIGHEIARSLGHNIVPPVPSLFTFDSKELVGNGGVFDGLAGVSLPSVRLTLVVDTNVTCEPKPIDHGDDSVGIKKKRRSRTNCIIQEGPLLITHHGISGPATLRLSAFAAREFSSMKYNCTVKIHFCPRWEEQRNSSEAIAEELWKLTRLIPKRRVSTGCPLFMKPGEDGTVQGDAMASVLPKRLWSALVSYSEIPPDTTWGDASKSMIRSLSAALTSFPFTVTSKGVFKEEFVTAGGVQLKEVRMSNMESKLRPGLFLCGEVLDVDGVTGGFNFMGCWSTGFIAGEGAAEFCCERKDSPVADQRASVA